MMRLARTVIPNRAIRLSANNFSNFVVKSPFPDVNLAEANGALPQFIMKDFLKEDRSSLEAIVDGSNGKSLTYKQAHDNTYSFAHSLRKFGIKKGDCIAVISPNHLQFFTAFFGIGLTGAVSSCINPLYSEYEIESQIEATNAKMILTHPLCLEKVLKVKKNIPIMLMDDVPNKPAHVLEMKNFIQESLTSFDTKSFALPANFDSNDTYTIPFSSGTTGKSKGVMLTHRNLISNVLQMVPIEGRELALTAAGTRGVALNPLPYFHIYGLVVGMMIPAHAGAKQVFLPAFDLKLFLETIQKHKVTRGYIVPPIALALAKHPMVDQYDLSSVTNLMSGAAPLGFDVQALCAKRLKCTVKQGWGMTELSPVATALPAMTWDELEKLGATSGKLVPNSEGKIVDPQSGADVDPTTEGEILIRGPHVMKGYLNNEQATNDMITKDGWLHSGDIGRFDKEGNIYLTDRMKELIKYKGFQVPPAELEALINSMPQVKDCIVIPVACPEAGEVPRAYVVKQDNCPTDFKEQDVVDFITSRVAPYKKLRGGVRFTAVIPKSPSGKLLRRVQRDIDKELDSKSQ